MTFLNFSDYLKFQLQRDIQSEEFANFILNQKLIKIGKRSEMNANISFTYENTTNVILTEDNTISGDKIEFHSCNRNVIYYSIVQPESADTQTLLLKAEVDKATVAHNLIFLVKNVSLVEAEEVVTPAAVAEKRELEQAYA